MNEPNTVVPEVSVEVMPVSAIEALERAAVDVQVSTAHRFPRTLAKFKSGALAMATLDQETAESCCYTRPVGKKKDAKGAWVQEYAEGASIRLAEIVAACYGNLRVASRIIEQTPRYVKCEGVAHDLESNYAGKSESFEPTVKSDGTPYSEGMRAVVAKAALSKAYRDAVFKVVPRALCKPIYEAAKKVAAGEGQTIEKRRLKAKAWLSSVKVDDARLFAALGVTDWDSITGEHLEILTGLKTAIGDKDTTVEEAFPSLGAEVKKPLFGKESSGAQTQSQGKAPTGEVASATGGTVAGAASEPNKPEPTDLEKFRALIVESKRDEGVVLQYLRNIGMVEESLATLDDVWKVNPAAITKGVAIWKKTLLPKINI